MRVLVSPGSAIPGQRTSLDESEMHHLRVRRAREQDGVEVRDGAGLIGTGRLVRVGASWMVEVETTERQARRAELTLAVAAGDRERFSWMVEKAVELGVTSVVPLETARTAGVTTRVQQGHIGKLRSATLEATKQCGAAWAPSIETPMTLAAFALQPISGIGWLADLTGGPAPAGLDQTPLTIVVGPEGGFTGEERTALLVGGYQPIALASNTLRFETAAIAAAAVATAARLRGVHD